MTESTIGAARRVVITFVNDEAGIYLYTLDGPEELKIVMGGISANKAIVEHVLVQALSRMVNHHLRLKRRRRKDERKRRLAAIARAAAE